MNGQAEPAGEQPASDEYGEPAPPFEVLAPARQTAPLVLASPHSGRCYPPAFVAGSALDPLALRRSEDAFVDEIFAAAPLLGAPLLRACYPRAYVDPNHEPWELDPAMFDGPLPEWVNTDSPRVAGGLGTIARVVTDGAEIYRRPLSFAEARRRVTRLYQPYHAALRTLVDGTRERFGCCILLDCHSMPSVGGPMDRDPGARRVDFVLGDAFSRACDSRVMHRAEEVLTGLGFRVARNNPYAGGFTTRHYGDPEAGVHALQIEINRGLYMDEARIERSTGMAPLAGRMREVIAALSSLGLVLAPAP